MKKRLLMILAVAFLLVGCGNQQETNNPGTEQPTTSENTSTNEPTSAPAEALDATEELTATEEPTQPPHEHTYTESVTKEATCTEAGEKTFACDCGDTHIEVIDPIGHIFETYAYNEDATYFTDGTETSICTNCEVSDTRAAVGTKLEYTYTDLDIILYASSEVNVRNLPSTDGEKINSLKASQEVKVTGQCVETNWYRIDLDGSIGYVSNSYLTDTKPLDRSSLPSCPYELLTLYDDGGKEITYYYIYNGTYDYVPPMNEATDILVQRGYTKTYTDENGTVYSTACVAWDYQTHEYAEGTVMQCNIFYGEFLNSITGLPEFHGEGVMVATRY